MKDKKIEYKGYTVTQAYNGHVMISKDGNMCFHSQIKRPYTEQELKQVVEHYEKMHELSRKYLEEK